MKQGILDKKEDDEKIKQKEAMRPIICPKCSKINPAGSLYCNCGMCLNYDESTKIEEMKQLATEQAMEELLNIAKKPELMMKFEEFKKNFN